MFTLSDPSALPCTVSAVLSTNHVKRPMNAFMVWSKQRRKELSRDNPTVHNSELSKRLGSEWRALSEDEKLPFIKASKKIRERHHASHPGYRYSSKRKKEPSEMYRWPLHNTRQAVTVHRPPQHLLHRHPMPASIGRLLCGSMVQPQVGHSIPLQQPTIPSVLPHQARVTPAIPFHHSAIPIRQLSVPYTHYQTQAFPAAHGYPQYQQPSSMASYDGRLLPQVPPSRHQPVNSSGPGRAPSTSQQQQHVVIRVDKHHPSKRSLQKQPGPVVPGLSKRASQQERTVICIDDSPLQRDCTSSSPAEECSPLQSEGSSPVSPAASELLPSPLAVPPASYSADCVNMTAVEEELDSVEMGCEGAGCKSPDHSITAVGQQGSKDSTEIQRHSVEMASSEQVSVAGVEEGSKDSLEMTAVLQGCKGSVEMPGDSFELQLESVGSIEMAEVDQMPAEITGQGSVECSETEQETVNHIAVSQVAGCTSPSSGAKDGASLTVVPLTPIVNSIASPGIADSGDDITSLQGTNYIIHKAILQASYRATRVTGIPDMPGFANMPALKVTAVEGDGDEGDGERLSTRVLVGNLPTSLEAATGVNTGVESSVTSPTDSKSPHSPTGRCSVAPLLPPLIRVSSLEETEHSPATPSTSNIVTHTSYTFTAAQSKLKGNTLALWSSI